MVKMMCSLCKKEKKARPLDMDDLLFGSYVKLMRSLRLSKHTNPLGVCAECMPAYMEMQARYQQKIMFYGMLGFVFAAAYFYFTNNFIASLVIGAFVFSMAILNYCPPLKE